MLTIKLTEEKELQITVNEPIYRGENVEKGIMFLIPKQLGPIDDMKSAKLYLTYIRPDGVAEMVWLWEGTKYNTRYYQYLMPYNTKFTRCQGQVTLWFQIYDGSGCKPIILKSSEVEVTVLPSQDADQFIEDGALNLIYSVQKGMEEHVQEKIDELAAKKADNIEYDAEAKEIKLKSEGEDLGDPVDVTEFVPPQIKQFWISDQGNLWALYDNGDRKNIGHVKGADGVDGANSKVYVPKIDEHKILTFELSEEPGEPPQPVDLNPLDEWSTMQGREGHVNYVWETMN